MKQGSKGEIKWKSNENQSENQFNKKWQINHENQEFKNSKSKFTKKYNYYDQIDHFEKNCWKKTLLKKAYKFDTLYNILIYIKIFLKNNN